MPVLRNLRYCTLLACSLFTLNVVAKPLVVTSIKPLQLIVAQLAGDLVETRSLLTATVSPHDYQLRPSDRLLMNEADLLVWVGPDLERFLAKPVAMLPAQRSLQLLSEPALPEQDDDEHHHGKDPHLWLSPLEVIEISGAVAERLAALDAPHADQYRHRQLLFAQAMKQLDADIAARVRGLQQIRYLVLHDGYHYFEQQYNLSHQAALALSPDRQPGARHLAQMHALLAGGDIDCLLREPQFDPKWLQNLLDGSGSVGIKIVLMDPLAINIDVTEQGYSEFMRGFVDHFMECMP